MVTFTMLSTYKNSLDFQQDLGIAMGLEFHYQYMVDGISPVYTEPVGGFVNNTETEFNGIVWMDPRPQPSWTDLVGPIFNFWKMIYRMQAVNFGVKQDVYWALEKPALDLKADVSALSAKADASSMSTALAGKADVSHTHAQSDISNLSTDLAAKASASAVTTALSSKADTSTMTTALAAKADAATVTSALAAKADISAMTTALLLKVSSISNQYIHKASGLTDANGEVQIHFTVDGLSTGAALFNGAPIVAPCGADGSTSPIQAPNVSVKGWSNSNKTVTLRVNKGTSTAVLIGGTVVSDAYAGAGYTVEVIAVGTKA